MEIQDVSDTAFWVAAYRANESRKPDALFKDPFAEILAGERGQKIASAMTSNHHTEWTLVVRTVIIDELIQSLAQSGEIDMVINLGAGLDARPYRLDLPSGFRWIEVDYPHMIDFKRQALHNYNSQCDLERISADLSEGNIRREIFSRQDFREKKVLVLTEGVLPYLTEKQVVELGNDINMQPSFLYWIAEYISPVIRNRINTKKRLRQMRNAPFHFIPDDWFGFFNQLRWKPREIRWMGEEGRRLGRPFPMLGIAKVAQLFMSREQKQRIDQLTAYVLLEKAQG